ncbi:MAG: family 78 glycoside hydrolase catalytic domain [Mucilaginibacter polytrichastri]|nr:family 78 glycoside hydrolase catalytic domain [Mucilaginibacter polytrichastri]
MPLNLLKRAFFTPVFFVSAAVSFAQQPSARNLQCEYLVNPLGIDVPEPRLSWQLNDTRTGAAQSAYQVEVTRDTSKSDAVIWNSKVRSDQNRVRFAGKKLEPYTRYFWRVTLWDASKKKLATTPYAFFETGLMDKRNWKGFWISDDKSRDEKAAPYFRKPFSLAKKVREARAYIAVGGLYELYINGRKIGNHRLDPMYTRFDRRTLYVTYDVTKELNSGDNAVGVLLGNGWYNHQSTAVWDFHNAPWRNRPAFCLDLRITYDDGTVETITSDKSWKTALSPVVFNSIYTAEHFDGRKALPGWNTANYTDTTKWKEVINRSAPSANIVSQALHPVRNVDSIPAISAKKLNDTTWLFDLGRNISGVSKFTVKNASGTTFRLKHAERLSKNGYVDQSNIDAHYRPTDNQDPFQTDIFTPGGNDPETFMPKFNYKGFQYVEVTSNKPVTLTKENLCGFFMHSDVPPVGKVSASNPMINKLWSATNNSYLSNLFGYPTDCPQREKNGWTGDAHIAIETGLYNFDGITVYEKWLADHRDEQQPNGVLPSIIPTGGWGYEWGNGPDWTSTIAIIPWNAYLFYGDTTILAQNYPNLKRYVDHIDELYPSGLTTWGLGDWVPVKSKSPVELTSSVYYFTDATILSKTAKLLGRNEDHQKYAALAEKIRKAINDKFLNRETGVYGSGVQTELSVPLYWGVVPDELRGKVAAKLAERVKADNFHLDVGLLGTKAILNALSENGYADFAYKIAAQEDFPSWGWWIKNGATTLYENWPIDAKSDISMNHIMFGEIGAWLYKGIAGIKPDENSAGFKNVVLQPHFVAGLDQFSAEHKGPQGNIRSSWQRKGKAVTYTVTIPANSTASLYLPVGSGRKVRGKGNAAKGEQVKNQGENSWKTQLDAGTYVFEVK